MVRHNLFALTLLCTAQLFGCRGVPVAPTSSDSSNAAAARLPSLPRIIVDSDANNELDDQHAIAYALFNSKTWQVEGITTNKTSNGGDVVKHTEEALRVVKLCGADSTVKVYTGANGGFQAIKDHVGEPNYDGKPAVDFILERSRAAGTGPLTLVPIGKMTNIALALTADPTLANRIRVLWLASNWPAPGEYNLDNDLAAASFVLESTVPLDIAVVREGGSSGTAAVKVSLEEIRKRMPGLGPKVPAVVGRHGGSFTNFGDYSVSLFANIGQTERSMYDMATLALLKNPAWATWTSVGAPRLDGAAWSDRPTNPRKIRFATDLNRDAIIADLFASLQTQ